MVAEPVEEEEYSLWYVVPNTLPVGYLVAEITRSPTGKVLSTTYHKLYYTV
jgi:hypothetical protein